MPKNQKCIRKEETVKYLSTTNPTKTSTNLLPFPPPPPPETSKLYLLDVGELNAAPKETLCVNRNTHNPKQNVYAYNNKTKLTKPTQHIIVKDLSFLWNRTVHI